MRGSPILRFILLAIALAATALGLQRVTSTRVEVIPDSQVVKPDSKVMLVPFQLTLSAPATVVEILSSNSLRPSTGESPLSGMLEMDSINPQVALIVRWKNPPSIGEHRFAKLTLDPPKQDTFIHVFDAQGDIDDMIELPLPAASHE